MKKIGMLFLLVCTFAAGYLANHVMVETAEPSEVGDLVEDSLSIARRDEVAASAIDQTVANKKENFPPAESPAEPPVESPDNQPAQSDSSGAQGSVGGYREMAGNGHPPKSKSNQSPSAITDEEIDKILPPPFNQQLKNNQGDIREKYKAFANATEPQESDVDVQNKLADAISSNPYAKFLNIESLLCRENICEIRLYETKSGVWSYIQAEMHLQDWWSFGSTSASGFDTGTPEVTGWYVLLVKK